jgi:carboxymethylenebutenolidase
MIPVTAFDGGQFEAYLALPPSGRGPGIVLMQEIFGVNDVMRAVADRYAKLGFVVICPDLFWRQEPGVQLTDQTDEGWQRAFGFYKGLDESKAVDDAAAAMKVLREHPACTGKIGGVGFCLGGKLAYLLAVRYQPECSVGYYGVGIENALDEIGKLRTPLMLHVAGQDEYCPPEAQAKIHAALDSVGLATLHDYPQENHAFGRPGGAHFSAASAELARLRTLDFFVRNLVAAAPPLSELWDEHVKHEFAGKDTAATLATMVPDAYVNHIPVLTGGVGQEQLSEFYSQHFIPQMPPDTRMTPVSRTVGTDQLVDEMVFEFTHTVKMDWMLPGLQPTGKHVKVPLAVIVHFRDGKLAHEHIYWDQASVLAQLGLIDVKALPVAGAEAAEKVLNPSLPSRRLAG